MKLLDWQNISKEFIAERLGAKKNWNETKKKCQPFSFQSISHVFCPRIENNKIVIQMLKNQ